MTPPTAATRVAPHGGGAVPVMAPGNLRVLVVDSQAASRLSAVQLLRDCQYQVRTPVDVSGSHRGDSPGSGTSLAGP